MLSKLYWDKLIMGMYCTQSPELLIRPMCFSGASSLQSCEQVLVLLVPRAGKELKACGAAQRQKKQIQSSSSFPLTNTSVVLLSFPMAQLQGHSRPSQQPLTSAGWKTGAQDNCGHTTAPGETGTEIGGDLWYLSGHRPMLQGIRGLWYEVEPTVRDVCSSGD